MGDGAGGGPAIPGETAAQEVATGVLETVSPALAHATDGCTDFRHATLLLLEAQSALRLQQQPSGRSEGERADKPHAESMPPGRPFKVERAWMMSSSVQTVTVHLHANQAPTNAVALLADGLQLR